MVPELRAARSTRGGHGGAARRPRARNQFLRRQECGAYRRATYFESKGAGLFWRRGPAKPAAGSASFAEAAKKMTLGKCEETALPPESHFFSGQVQTQERQS